MKDKLIKQFSYRSRIYKVFLKKIQIKSTGELGNYSNIWEDEIPFLEKAIKEWKKHKKSEDKRR